MFDRVLSYSLAFVAGAAVAIGFLVIDARLHRDNLAEWLEISKANYAEAVSKLKGQGYNLVYIGYEVEDDDPQCVGEEGCYWYRALTPDGRYAEGVVRAGKKT